ncbi:MAG TPA: hypothetical protein VKB34_23255, partial [Povalibacter sp.]|nr:hypothetical protein [Povalibacter sp.]
LVTFVSTCLVALLFSACGGGGGSGGGGSPRQNSRPGDFTLTTDSVILNAKIGDIWASIPLGVHLNDSVPGAVVAGYRPGVSPADWLNVSDGGSFDNITFTFHLNAPATSISPGTYRTTITIATTDRSGNPLVTRDVQVTLNLREGVRASIASASLIDATVGSSVNAFTSLISVAAPASFSWRASSSVPWLTFTGGAQGQGEGLINVSIDTSALATGDRQARVTVTNTADPTDTANVFYTVRMVAPVLTLSTPSLLLGGNSGLDTRPGDLRFSINTAANSHPWTVTTTTNGGGNWLQSSAATGTVSAAEQGIVVIADVSALTKGTYTGSVALQVMVNGQPVAANIPVTLNVDSNRFVISATGVAFSSVPGRRVLTRTLTLTNSLDLAGIGWHAHSDQGWLSVTPSGTGSSLTLTADPSGMAAGQYFANVDITPDTAGIVNTQSVRVGLYISDTAPPPSVDIPVVNAEFTASSPVAPEFYTIEAGNIRVYSAYSGALLRTLATIAGDTQSMTISDDGRVIYVLTDSMNVDGHVSAIDAVSGSVQGTWVLPVLGYQQGGGRNGVQYMRPDAHPVLLASVYGQYIDFAADQAKPSYSVFLSNSSDVSSDQRRLYTALQPFSPSDVLLQEVRYSTLSDGLSGRRLAENSGHFDPGSRANCADTALAADQSRVYLACGAPYQFDYLDSGTLVYGGALPADAYPNNIETSWNGLIAATATIAAPASANLWVYDSLGVRRALLGAGGGNVFQRTLRFSGDGTRLLTTTETGMRIQSAP